MNIQIPVKWLQELLALCGPEDHELRERVMASITAMNEQAAGPVVTPEPDAAIKEAMELVGTAMDSAMKAGELLLDSHEKFNAQFASAKSLKNSIESKLRALLATATGLPAKADTPDSFREWFAKNYPADTIIVDPDWHAKSIFRMAQAHARLAAPQAQADARDAARFRWLVEDHASLQARIARNAICERLAVMSYSAACADIDAASAIAAAKGEGQC